MGSGPIAMPSGNPGQQANALAKVREAIKILEGALPQLPTGTEPYKAVLDAITKISKHVAPSSEVPGVQQTALRDLGQQAQQSSMLQSLMRSMGSSEAGGKAPGAASPSSSSGAAPGAAAAA